LISGAGAEFPLKEAGSVDGIISSHTQKRRGNVQDKGIVTVTSKSAYGDGCSLRNIVDVASLLLFNSKDEPGQWVCWDFRELRIKPTHYTIKSWILKSWLVESSLDGDTWTEIDRKTGSEDFKVYGVASFAVSESAECRFIRLTQTGKTHDGHDYLAISAFEFFGTWK
jgi:hypothetical protein